MTLPSHGSPAASPAPRPVPGAHPDDASVAGEEDPGASLGERPDPPAPSRPPPAGGPAPGR